MTDQANKQVIFGTGPLGQSVMRALLENGYEDIRMVNRSGKRGEIPARVQVVASDAYDVQQTTAVTQGAAVVYQCAQPAYTQWPEKFPPLQRAILEGAAANNAKLILGENCYMYGQVDGRMHEDLPYNAHTRKGRTRAAMAEEALAAHRAGTVRVALGRGSDFYGEGVLGSSMGDRVILPLMQGKPAQFIGDPDQPHTYTYIGDFGRALVILGEREDALGRAWHVPNAEPEITTREMIERIAALLGVEPQISVMPKLMLHTVGRVHPLLREVREMIYEFNAPFIVDDSQFVAAFGQSATPIDEGLRRTLAWYRQHAAQVA